MDQSSQESLAKIFLGEGVQDGESREGGLRARRQRREEQGREAGNSARRGVLGSGTERSRKTFGGREKGDKEPDSPWP